MGQMTTYDKIFGRSFSRKEQKTLECGAFVMCGFIIMALILFILNVPYLGPLTLANFEVSITARVERLMNNVEEINNPNTSYHVLEEERKWQPRVHFRDFSNSRSDVCEMKGDIRICGNSSIIFVPSFQLEKKTISTCPQTIAPYARKADQRAMIKVTKMKIKEVEPNRIPYCSQKFNVPAITFSTEGYAGNHFHDFTDVLVPLYLTSRQFDGQVVFLITNKHGWWTFKYNVLLKRLSSYELMDIDKQKEVLCFPRMIVGLKANREFGIDSSKTPHYSTIDFTRFLRSTYSLERESISLRTKQKICRPRMLIVSRKKTRHLTNEGEVAKMARRLGFDVVVKEMWWNVSEVAKFVNSFDVMMGVHGAGLTNMVFLPENAVVVQIVPLGLDFLGRDYFQLPAKDMNLKYVEYQVSLNESSLLGRYPNDSEVYRDPFAIHEKGFPGFRSVYLDNQDVRLDLTRFRRTLFKVLELIDS